MCFAALLMIVLFEVLIHSCFQQLEEQKNLEGKLKILSQMRSANKKHKCPGDSFAILRDFYEFLRTS